MSCWKLFTIIALGVGLMFFGFAITQQIMIESAIWLLCSIGCMICALLLIIIDRLPPRKD